MIWPKRKNESSSAASAVRIYAIGDIHGMVKQLRRIHALIRKEEERRGPATRSLIVYIGDYIDRGRYSRDVVDFLLGDNAGITERVFLKGNHEQAMLGFMRDPDAHDAWLNWGGIDMLMSYGIDAMMVKRNFTSNAEFNKHLAEKLKETMPEAHKQFYASLKTVHVEEDYLFVHAGLRPGVPMDRQRENDMLTIRDEFIYSTYDFGKTVVFGHTIFDKPFQRPGRLGIDTGAYATGGLTCAVIQGGKVQFLQS